MTRTIFGCIGALALTFGMLAAQAPAAELTADAVVAKTGVAGGLYSFPRATAEDEKLVIDLAKRTNVIVHAMAKDEKVVAKLRDAGEAAGLLGKSLYVEAGDAAKLPFADRLVDAMVVTDLAEGDLRPELRAEWLRVLAPRRGSALVGRAKGLGEAALKAWAKDLPLSRTMADDSGTWLVLKAELPAGSDSWTHRCHAADNAQVSTDSTFKPPFLAQWWALPRQEGFWGTTVVSGNGRMFTVRASRRSYNPVVLTARSLTNGLVLWQKVLRPAPESAKAPHGGYVPSRQCIAVNGDTLCLIDRDGVALLDAETGKELERIIGPKAGGQVKWLAVSDGKLAVLAGEADTMQVIDYQTVATSPIGRDLAVYDLATRKELWRDTVGGDIDERALAVRDGRLVYLAQEVGVVARAIADGKEAWKNPDPAIQANFKTPPQKQVGQLLSSQPVMLALEDVVILRTPWAKQVYALSAKDGAALWNRPSGVHYRGLTALAVDGLWLGEKGMSVDLKTGKDTAGTKFVMSGCGPTTSVPGYLITCFGGVNEAKTGKAIRPADLKSPCDIGSLVSEGIMVTVPSECGCAFEVKCYRALASAGSFNPHAAPAASAKDRLTVLDSAVPAAPKATDADWPTYRRDVIRSGATPVAVGDSAKILWHWKPAGATPYKDSWNAALGQRVTPDFVATAPVAVDGRVYFVSHDGVVRCLKAEDGKELWKFATGAMCFAPPTIWEGRALVGSGDGRVYCLDATTGRPLWKLQVAPCERRLLWMGHVISTWPVTGGVVVQDGVGYAVAGYAAENGIHACAFDPKSGQVSWEKHDAGSVGVVSGGHMTVFEGRLWLAGMTGGNFDLKTGEYKKVGQGYGQEIGVLCNKWVVGGARRLTELQSDIGFAINGKDFPGEVYGCTSLPAWDGELVVFGSRGASGPLMAVNVDKYIEMRNPPPPPAAPAQPAPSGPSAPPAPPVKPKLPSIGDIKLWAGPNGTAASHVLAKNAVVLAQVGGDAGHKLVALKRADGSVLWSVDLPEQPAMNRMAIDRDGRVLVGLCDGSVICVGK